MYFIVILAFALLLNDPLPAGIQLIRGDLRSLSVWGPTVLVAWSTFYVPLIIALIGRWHIRKLPAGGSEHEELIATRMTHWQVAVLIALGVTLAAGMLLTPWVSFVKTVQPPPPVPHIPTALQLGQFPLIGDLVVLAPLLSGLVAVWVVFYPVELQIKSAAIAAEGHHEHQIPVGRVDGHVSLMEYLIDKCRHQFLLVAAPMFLIVFTKHYTDAFGKQPQFQRLGLGFNVGDVILGVVAFLILLVSPVLLRYTWSTKSLPAGPLRTRFEAICRRIGLRYRDILLWRTHGMAANAAVMGFVPPLRYVLITDALLESMNDDEIEAVFGHEAGHVHHWHLPFFGVFAIISMYLAGGVFLLLSPRFLNMFHDQASLQLISLAVLMGMWLFGFGWLSRRFERQADLFGVRCMTPDVKSCLPLCPVHGTSHPTGICLSATSLFGRTLIKIAELNGIPREAPSWRHGSIESRCQLLERFSQDSIAVADFDRSVRMIKTIMLFAAVIGTIGMVMIYWPGVIAIVRVWWR